VLIDNPMIFLHEYWFMGYCLVGFLARF